MAAMIRAASAVEKFLQHGHVTLTDSNSELLIGVYRLLCVCLPSPIGNMLCRKRTERLRRQATEPQGGGWHSAG
jgi:hypothetical protein